MLYKNDLYTDNEHVKENRSKTIRMHATNGKIEAEIEYLSPGKVVITAQSDSGLKGKTNVMVK